MRLLICLFLFASQAAIANDCVVLVHGLGRTSHSMNFIENSLESQGYIVVNNSYPSREKSVDELASVVGDGISACKESGAQQIHFVTHSLGGLLVRQYFQEHVIPEAKRVVMLGPPNHGSEVATKNRDKWWYKLSTGPAGQELGIETDSTPNRLKPVSLEIGIIAGTVSLDPWFSGSVPKPNDGKVSVASTQLAEMKDFITVPHSHTFIANAEIVATQVKHFLAQGRFSH